MLSMKVSMKVFLAAAISVAAVTGFTASSMAGGEGEGIFKAKKCNECHATSGPSKIASVEEWEKRKGPDLWFAGSKFNKEWLEKWMAAPKPIRGVKWNSLEPNTDKHPALSGKEADEVAEYLMSLKDKEVKSGGANMKVNRIQAKILFEKKNACYACHKVKSGAKEIGGISGPTFVGAKDRLQPDWVAAFLKNPDRYEPKGRMPNFTYLSGTDIGALSGYTQHLK